MTIFENAPILQTRPAKRSRRRRRDEVELQGLQNVVALRVVCEKIKELMATADSDTKWHASQHFLAEGCAKREKPDSFIGVDDIASALVALRVRSVNSPLTEDEVALLDAERVVYETVVDQEETYAINPLYVRNEKLMKKVDVAVSRIPGIPSDFFVKQPGRVRRVVSQEALEGIFNLPPERAAPLLRIMSSIAITPTVDERAFPLYLKMVHRMLAPPKAEPVSKPEPVRKATASKIVVAGRKKGAAEVARQNRRLVKQAR